MTLALSQETNVETLRALTVSVWEEEVRYPNSQVLALNIPKQSITIDVTDVAISLHLDASSNECFLA